MGVWHGEDATRGIQRPTAYRDSASSLNGRGDASRVLIRREDPGVAVELKASGFSGRRKRGQESVCRRGIESDCAIMNTDDIGRAGRRIHARYLRVIGKVPVIRVAIEAGAAICLPKK